MKNIAILMSALLLLNAADGHGGYAEISEANRGICEEMAAKIGVPADKLNEYMAACLGGAKGRPGGKTRVATHQTGKTKHGKAAKGDRKKGSKRSRQLAEAKPGKSKSAKKTAKADSAVSSKKTKKGVADAAKKSHKAGAKSDRKSRRSS